MKCSQCGTNIRSGKNFCASCGHSVLTLCLCCGASCNRTDSFCDTCGNKINIGDDIQSVSTKSEHVPQQIIQPAKNKFEGVRKHITILFTDIVGSTSMTVDLDPEEARNLLIPVIQEMLNAVYRYDGTVIHTAGDGLTAIFGAPKSLENHALHACLAAITMKTKVQETNDAITIRVGMNSGEVVLDMVGDSKHLEYDIIGSAVNLAARMEQTAKPNCIQMTKEVLKLVENNVSVETLEPIQVKGFKYPIAAFKLKSINNINKLFTVINCHDAAPLINREDEMAKLNQMLEQAKRHKGTVVSLVGEAGLGKSRLVYEFLHSNAAKKCNQIETSGFSHTLNINLFPIVNIFQKLMEIESSNSIDEVKTKIDPFIRTISLPYAMNATLAMLQLSVKDSNWNNLSPEMKRRYTFEVGIRILLNQSINNTCILLIEDMHWADSETEAFINLLMAKMNDVAMLLLLTSRPEYQAHWSNKINNANIILSSLQKDSEEIMLDHLLGNDPSLTDIKIKLLSECSGNPFFIEEMIKNLVSQNILIGEPKHYHVNVRKLISILELPESIFSVLQAQINNLPEQQRKILQVASIIGQRFTYDLLSQVSDMSHEDLRKSLNELLDNKYIYNLNTFPEPEFSFKHALIQEVLNANLLKTVRKSIHQKIVIIMEKTFSTRSHIDKLQILANHAYQSEVWDKALYYCKMAAEKLFLLNSLNLSTKLYNKSLLAAEHLPQDKNNINIIVNIYVDMHLILNRMGRFEENRLLLNKAMEIVTSEKDSLLMTIFYSFKSVNCLFFGETIQALELAKLSYDLAVKVDKLDAKLTSLLAMSYSHLFLGEYAKAFKFADELLNSLSDINYEPYRMPYGYLISFYLIWNRAFTGDFLPIESQNEKLLQTCNLEEISFHSYLILGAIGLYYFYKGQLEEAIDYLSRALTYAINLETIISIPTFASALGCAYLELNQQEEGQQYINQAINTGRKLKFAFYSACSLGSMCEGLLLLGEYEKAKDLIQESFKIIEARQMKGHKAWLLRIEAEIDMQLSNPDYFAIKKQLEVALQMAQDLDMLAHVAHCRLALGKLYQRSGDKIAAKNEFNIALIGYQTLGMSFWLQKCQQLTALNEE